MFVCPANGGFSNFTGNDRKLYHLRIALKTHVYHTSLISLIELLFAGKFKFDLSESLILEFINGRKFKVRVEMK